MKYFWYLTMAISAHFCRATPPDTLDHFPNYRVQGSTRAFYRFIGENLRYPQPARQSAVIGTAIVSIILKPSGNISVAIVNSLGNSIDNELLTTFQETQPFWLSDSLENQDLILFLPVTFVINEFEFARNSHTIGFMQEEILVTTQSGGGGNRVPKPDHTLVEKAITYYHEKKYKRTLNFLDELIRRNPFNSKLYKMRGHCRYELDDQWGACQDYQKIKALLHQPIPETAVKLCQQI